MGSRKRNLNLVSFLIVKCFEFYFAILFYGLIQLLFFYLHPTEPNNVISILISSDFLKMDALVSFIKIFFRIPSVILLQEKFLQFDWLRAVVFQLNLKYLHVKITNLLQVVV